MNLTPRRTVTVTSLSAAPCATGSGPLALRDRDRRKSRVQPAGAGPAREAHGDARHLQGSSGCGGLAATGSEVDPWALAA